MAKEFTDIEAKPNNSTGLDFSMNIAAGPSGARGGTEPNYITKVPVDNIVIGVRQRAVNRDKVGRFYNDIGLHGLLEPIALQKGKTDYTIVYGVHRFLAFKQGWEEAKRLIAERGDKDPEAYRMARMWQMIPAIIYDYDMPRDYALLKEIAENLMRTELTADEQALHRTKYTHLLKKLKLVATADDNRSGKQKGKPKQKDERVTHDVSHVKQPTATEKTTADLGVTRQTLQRDHKKITDIAKATARVKGLSAPESITPESKPEKVEYTLQLAELGLNMKAEAREAGEDERKVVPIQPSEPDEITVRVDVTDPKQLLNWFKKRLAAATKPMPITYLLELQDGLRELISEHLAKKEPK